jgi:hypothetical protein
MKTLSNSKVHAGFLACALAATAMVSTSTATAQGRQMEVKVPFAFHNGSQRLPAGVYRVEIQSEHLILLRGSHGSGYAMGNPQMSQHTTSRGKVVFRRYGDQYFLREVWTNGSNTGIECLKSKQEKEAQIAAANIAPSGREVALVQQGR